MALTEIHGGVQAAQLSGAHWRKSKHSGAVGNCVEVALLREADDCVIAVRNSRFPDGPALIYTREEMAAFVSAAKDGEFDDLIG